MKPILNEKCECCGTEYDPVIGECPKCQKRGVFFEIKDNYLSQSRIGFKKNILLFLIGFAGFQIIGVIISVIVGAVILSHDSSIDLSTALYESGAQIATNGITYLATFGLCFLIIKANLDEILKTFKKYKNLLIGCGWGIILIICSVIISLWAERIYPEAAGGNNNQSILVSLVDDFPLLSLLIFAFVGPFVEELTYRVGLFSLTSRVNKVFGYIVSAIIFALIHFDFTAFGTEQIYVELISLPDYIVAGTILSYLYDRYGLATSYSAHLFNNFVAIALMIIGNN